MFFSKFGTDRYDNDWNLRIPEQIQIVFCIHRNMSDIDILTC